MKKFSKVIMPIYVFLMMVVGIANASPIQWTIESGGNNHWYDLIFEAKTWEDAKIAAESSLLMGNSGHLATMTSATENQFLVDNFLSGRNGNGFWLGGYQIPEQSTTSAGWQWVTGESWDYTNWWLGNVVPEPNDWPGMGNEDGQENYMGFSHESFGQWNDTQNNEYWMSFGYFVEYEINNTSPVPEPTTILLFSTGIIGLAGSKTKKKKRPPVSL